MAIDPTERTLSLLSLLQSRRQWPASELAERFEVTERTIRRDVDRLRALGYPVDATPGRDGGYRLAAGARLPPLMFDDDEAVALVVGLRAAAGAAVAGIEDTAVRTMLKVEQALPDRLRRRVAALEQSVVSLQRTRDGGTVVAPATLSTLAAACRDGEEVRFEYRTSGGEEERRLVEPHQVLSAGHLWYLIAWDLRRADWRIFRLDRLDDVRLAGRRFVARPIPGGDAATFLADSVASMPRRSEARVEVSASAAEIERPLARLDHQVVETAAGRCTVVVRGDRLDQLVLEIAQLAMHAPLRVVGPEEVVERADRLRGRLAAS